MNRSRRAWLLIPAVLLGGVLQAAPPPAAAPRKAAAGKKLRYTKRRNHDRHGIGKFYMGREIAKVMGFGPGGQGARWLERNEREREERLALMVKSLGLKPGMVVADIGAGSGVITGLMAPRVAPGGKVIAVDVQPKMLRRLEIRMKRFGIKNVELVLGTQESPKLKPASIDLALFVDVYHEFKFPYEMMLEISKALKPGGRAAFVEYRMEDPRVPILKVHKMSHPEVGLRWKKTVGVLPRQHILMFERVAAAAGDKKAAP